MYWLLHIWIILYNIKSKYLIIYRCLIQEQKIQNPQLIQCNYIGFIDAESFGL